MGTFMAHAGLAEPPDPGASGPAADAPRWEPSPEQIARMRASTDLFLAHLIRPTTAARLVAPGPFGIILVFLSRTGRLLASWTSRAD
jgi:hypothetical protein